MATLAPTPSHGSFYANTTTAASYTGCAPCQHLSIAPGMGTWKTADLSIPALRTTQLIFDPNDNTTSTSVHCNSAALSAYPTTAWDPLYSLNDECQLIASYDAYPSHTATV